MALRQDLYNLDLYIYWQMVMVLHSQLLWVSSTLLEPAQFVFYKPNGKVAVIDDDDDDNDVNKNQFVHLQLYQKSENNHSIKDTGIILSSCTVQAGSSFLFQLCHWCKNMKCFPFTREEKLSLDTALGSVLLLECNRSSLGEKTYRSLC